MSRTAKEQEAYDKGAMDALAAIRAQMQLKRESIKHVTKPWLDGYSWAMDDVIHLTTEARLAILMKAKKEKREAGVQHG